MNEYLNVLEEFINGYGSITSNFVSYASGIAPKVIPILLISVACSILISFYRNIVK